MVIFLILGLLVVKRPYNSPQCRNDVNEVVLVSGKGAVVTTCYRESAGKHGWCGTTENIITGKQADAYKKVGRTKAFLVAKQLYKRPCL